MSVVTCSSCGTDNVAGTKACVDCGEPLPLVCAVCGNPVFAGQKFCSECGAAVHDAAPGGSANPRASTSSVVTVRDASDSVPVVTEDRRPVTAVFCDLVGSTELGERI